MSCWSFAIGNCFSGAWISTPGNSIGINKNLCDKEKADGKEFGNKNGFLGPVYCQLCAGGHRPAADSVMVN